MKRLFYIMSLLTLLLAGTLLTGCEKKAPEETEYYVYYLNKETSKILPVPYELKADTAEAMVEELIGKLSEKSNSVDYKRPMGKDVSISSWSLENGLLHLNFSSEYSQMDPVTEVLCRAAIVRTLVQVNGVDNLSFNVGDSPMLCANGKPVGLMNAESFIENPGVQINSIQTATITLYFSNDKGNGLIQEVQERHYNSNISLEKLVMEQLIKGPIGGEGKSVIPAGTKLVNVATLEGVCFVNLDGGFLGQNDDVDAGIVIYSIVNSLVELPSVNKVQISVNGDTSITYRETFPLSTVYERNLDYLEEGEKIE